MTLTLPLKKETLTYYKFSSSDDKTIISLYVKKELFTEKPKEIKVSVDAI